MYDRAKLYDLIVDAENEFHKKYHYAEDSKRIESVVDYLIAHGVILKQMQKPLMVTEVKNIAFRKTDKPPVVWVEFKKCRKRSRYVYVETVGELYRLSQMLSDYGNNVRCWAEKPTEEERKAAEWKS